MSIVHSFRPFCSRRQEEINKTLFLLACRFSYRGRPSEFLPKEKKKTTLRDTNPKLLSKMVWSGHDRCDWCVINQQQQQNSYEIQWGGAYQTGGNFEKKEINKRKKKPSSTGQPVVRLNGKQETNSPKRQTSFCLSLLLMMNEADVSTLGPPLPVLRYQMTHKSSPLHYFPSKALDVQRQQVRLGLDVYVIH